MTRPNSLPLLPPLGCAVLFFWGGSWFFGFLFSSSMLFFSAMANKTKNQQNKKPEQHETKKTKNTNIYIYIYHIIYDLF